MSFFEPPPPSDPPVQRSRPTWLGAPDNELGVVVPLRVVLVRTDALAILVDQVVAYTTGFSFRLAGRARPGSPAADEQDFANVFHPPRGGMDRLLVGIELADGRRATNLEHRPPTGDDDGPILMGGGGGAGGGRFDFGFWVWPLPPEGALTFACQWAELGIELARVEVDAGPIRAAGARSEVLWPEQGDGGRWETRSEIT